jgi:hypothetical protein
LNILNEQKLIFVEISAITFIKCKNKLGNKNKIDKNGSNKHKITHKNNNTYATLNKGRTNKFVNTPIKLTVSKLLAQTGKITKLVDIDTARAFDINLGILILFNNLARVGANAIIERTHKKDS